MPELHDPHCAATHFLRTALESPFERPDGRRILRFTATFIRVSAMPKDFGFGGFFELRTPQQLLQKLRHDRVRLEEHPADSYAAFDFFVTANSLVDWVWPSATGSQPRPNRRSEAIPRICEHLADGAKHFVLTRPHKGVAATSRLVAARSGVARSGATRSGMAAPALVIELESDEARELGVPGRIGVGPLADMVLQYWSTRIGS